MLSNVRGAKALSEVRGAKAYEGEYTQVLVQLLESKAAAGAKAKSKSRCVMQQSFQKLLFECDTCKAIYDDCMLHHASKDQTTASYKSLRFT